MRKTYWMHTNQSIYEIVVKDEDRDVWKIYLGRSNWELARRYAKVRHSPFIPLAPGYLEIRIDHSHLRFMSP